MIRSQSILEALDVVMREPIVDTPFACPKCDFRFTGPSRVAWLSMILCPKCGSRIDYAPEAGGGEDQEKEGEEEEKPKKKKKSKKSKKKEAEEEPEEIGTGTGVEPESKTGPEPWESELDSYLK